MSQSNKKRVAVVTAVFVVSLLISALALASTETSSTKSSQSTAVVSEAPATNVVVPPIRREFKRVKAVFKRQAEWQAKKARIGRRVAKRRKAERIAREQAALAAQQADAQQTQVSQSGSGGAPNSHLARIAQCESGGNPAAVSPDGRYRGKYQFSRATWQSIGGQGDPAAAPESVQDQMAAKLYAQAGPGQWPVCQGR